MQPRNRIIGGLGVLGSLLLALFKDILFGWLGELGIAILPADTPNIFIQMILPYLPALLVFILGISAIMGWGAKTTVHFTKPFLRSKLIQPADTLSPAQGEHNPSRISMIELLNIAASRGWQFKGQSDKHRKSFARSLAQAGIDGRIKFCGTPCENVLELTDAPTHKWLRMSNDYWEEWGFDPDTFINDGLLQSDNILIITQHDTLGSGAGSWTDIQVDRTQALNWLAHEIVPQAPEPRLISLIQLMREAEKQGWYFTDDGSQHIFDFVRQLRDAGSTETIQFWGRPMQRIATMTPEQAITKIPSNYWQQFKIDGFFCLEHSNEGVATGITTNNSLTRTTDDTNQTPLITRYADIQLDRVSAVKWLAVEPITHRDKSGERKVDFAKFKSLGYLRDPETEITTAILMMVHHSLWGRQHFGNIDILYSQENLRGALQEAAILVWQAAKNDELTISGTKPGTSERERIPTSDWKHAVLNVTPCKYRGWKVVATPNDGNRERENKAWRYEDLEVNSPEFQALWPKAE